MKYIILTLLLTVQLTVAQQNNTKIELGVTNENVSMGIPTGSALQELVESDQLIYVTVGSMTGHLTAFEEFFRWYLYNKHGIRYKFYGCSLMGPELAFMNAMNNKIKRKLGDDFISREKALAKIEFEKQS